MGCLRDQVMSSLDLKKSDDDTVTNRYKNATT
jgi:hypothetical protein